MPTNTFDWIEGLVDPYCLCVIEGVDADAVLRRYGADPGSVFTSNFQSLLSANAMDSENELSPYVGIVDYEDLVLAVEPNGWHGSVPGILRNISASGRCASVFSNIEGVLRFAYSVDGDLIIYEEPWDGITPIDGYESAWQAQWSAGLFGEGDVGPATLLEIIERCMGATIPQSIFTGDLKAARLPAIEIVAGGNAYEGW